MNPLASSIINVVLILVSLVLIIAVLMQQGQRQGLGAIGGGAETFFGKNKAKGYEAKMAKITKIGAAVFIVLAIVATILTSHPAGNDDVTQDGTYTQEELEHDHDGDGIPEHGADAAGDELTDATEAPAGATEVPVVATTDVPVAAAATDVPVVAVPTDAPDTNE